MLILNFSHPLTEQHLEALRTLLGAPSIEVQTIPCQFDHVRPFQEQARELLDGVGLSAEQWQTTPLLLNLPSLAAIAAVVLAEVHGRAGYWPPILRLRPVADSVPPRFEVAEVIDLSKVRDAGRKLR
jgi:hypothetical protein